MLGDLVGRILAELRALGLEENTLVVFTTDHGDMMGAHWLIEKGPFTYEQRMVRTRTHKLVYNRSDIGELYDLADDPWEMRNLIYLPETRHVQNELLESMRERMVRLGDPALRFFDQIRHVC